MNTERNDNMDARAEARRMAEVMLAFADGAEVESDPISSNEWRAVQHPNWDWYTANYRVKPEPREWWIVPNAAHASSSRDEANELADSMEWPISSIVHVREVIP